MKKSRHVGSRAAKVLLPRPAKYQKVSTLQMLDTMQGLKNPINWTCYTAYSNGRPADRLTAWQEGVVLVAPGLKPGLDIWDIGAQHRTATIKLRLTSPSGAAVILFQKTDETGKPPADQPQPDINGFYTVEPNGANSKYNDYRIQSEEAGILLEAYYAAHPPPGFLKLKPKHRPGFMDIEDGGPPSIPPVNEN